MGSGNNTLWFVIGIIVLVLLVLFLTGNLAV